MSDSLHLFTLFLMDSLEKCQTKSLVNGMEDSLSSHNFLLQQTNFVKQNCNKVSIYIVFRSIESLLHC